MTPRPILLALLCLLAVTPGAAGGPRADTADGGVWHVRIRGDLDSARLARDFAETLNEADRDRPALILVEIEADRDRLDVVWMMGRAIRSAEAAVAVWLRDPRDDRVGLGAALLGAVADSCWISPGTAVATAPGAGLAELLPEDVDLERARREIRGAMWIALEERGADRRLAEALVDPRQEVWVGADAGVWSLTLGPDRPAGARRIVSVDAPGEPRVQIEADALLGLKLARDEVRTTGALLRRASAPTVASRHRTLRSGLDDAERSVRRAVLQLDEAIEQVERTLRVRVDRKLRGPGAERPYREAGARAATLIAAAAATLDDVEAQVRSYPEILCRPAPGQATLGDESAAQRAAAWRRALESRRRDLDAARARAEDYKRR
jgi:hypothetical protein